MERSACNDVIKHGSKVINIVEVKDLRYECLIQKEIYVIIGDRNDQKH